MLKKMFENVKENGPLIHCITNYVTVNDCANILIACGGSPIMADDEAEVEEITSICNGLVINIGTLNQRTIPSMLLAGKKSNELGHPVILDPVGAGASKLRTETSRKLIQQVSFQIIRGNISEIKTLAIGSGTTKGVDADVADIVTEDTIDSVISFAKGFAKSTGAVIVITGATDIVCDSQKAYIIRNGHPMMSEITGSGCMLTAMMGAYMAANNENPLEAAAAAVTVMGICGELAQKLIESRGGGNSTYRNYIIDEIYNFTSEKFDRWSNFEIR